MATIFTHPAVPVAIAMAFGAKHIPRPLLWAGIIASVLPDFDCAAFAFGIPYESQFGHRGFTHSIVFAIAFAALWAWRNMEFKVDGVDTPRWKVFAYIFICTVSHPFFDAFTDGGLGVAYLWPFSTERYFFSVTPIPVSPIGGSFFKDVYALKVLLTEIKLIWLPCLLLGIAGLLLRKGVAKSKG